MTSTQQKNSTKRSWRRGISGMSRSAAARLVAIAVLGGAIAVGCNAHGLTAPGAEGGPRDPMSHGGGGLGTDGLTELVVELVPLKREDDPEIANANPDFVTSTETVFPWTEAVTNSCVTPMETPVLNGTYKVREKLAMDDLTLKYKLQTWKDLRGVYATVTTYYDDDHDPSTAPKKQLVRYRNKQRTLDYFETGPAGIPFASNQESTLWLERLSPEHGMRYGPYDDRDDDDDDRDYRHGPGDDLFVYAQQRVTVDKNGATREKTVFRTECR